MRMKQLTMYWNRPNRSIWDQACETGLQNKITIIRKLKIESRKPEPLQLFLRLETTQLNAYDTNLDDLRNSWAVLQACKEMRLCKILDKFQLITKRGWAIHGGTAIPGQPVPGVKQASDPRTISKNQFNIWAPLGAYQILSW